MLRKIISESTYYMLERFEQNKDYPFIDTKFNITSDRNFSVDDEKFRQKEFIYGWIQGRGLESIAEHITFFKNEKSPFPVDRLQKMLETVTDAMEKLRQVNGGRITFAMSPNGESHFPANSNWGNYSDLFYSKGLFAAAHSLGRSDLVTEARKLFDFVIADIASDRFCTDQHGFDPKNPVAFVPGKFTHGPRMIALYGLARFAEITQEPVFTKTAAEFIRHILYYHCNHGQFSEMAKFDFWEAIDNSGKPWLDGEYIFCDPGHALEFIGLAGKCLLLMKKSGEYQQLIKECQEVLPKLFKHIFDLGFQKSGGIMKSFDLVSRCPINTDMPWWNLPETIRAGEEMLTLFPENSIGIAERIAIAERAFIDGFIAAGNHGFACQTRNMYGEATDVIPAVPDADPGYHTNLSLIDVLHLRNQRS